MDLSVIACLDSPPSKPDRTLHLLRRELDRLDIDWELILVAAGELPEERWLATHPRIRMAAVAPDLDCRPALRTGIEAACGEYVVPVDLGNPAGFEQIHDLVRALTDPGEPDLALTIGQGKSRGWRGVASRVLYSTGDSLIRLAVRCRFRHGLSASHAYRRRVLETLPFSERGCQIELLSRAVAAGLHVVEVQSTADVRSRSRLGQAALDVLRAFRCLLRERPGLLCAVAGLLAIASGAVGLGVIGVPALVRSSPLVPLVGYLDVLTLAGLLTGTVGLLMELRQVGTRARQRVAVQVQD